MDGIGTDCEAFENDVLRHSRRKIRVLFYWQTIGIVATISAVAALQTLQTSINIEGNKGAIALTAGYITSILFSTFCCPTVLRWLGPNIALVIADVCFLVYCLSNLSSELAVLTVGAIVSGIGRSVFFPTYTVLVLGIASGSDELSKSKHGGHYENYFQSRFYGMVESVTVIGNTLSYAILYGFASTSQSVDTLEVSTFSPPLNSTDAFEDGYQYCGVNDCQDPDVVNNSIDQYVPLDKLSVYILVSASSFIVLFGTFAHSFIYPGLGRYSDKLTRIKEKALEQLPKYGDNNNYVISVPKNMTYENEGFSSDEKEKNKENPELDQRTADADEENVKSSCDPSLEEFRKASEETDMSTEGESMKEILKATAFFFVKPRAFMLNVSTLHHGMMLGFVFADLTRAYASCVAGVDMTGLFVVAFGLTAMPSAILYGKLTFPRRRHILYAVSCTLELLLYVWCYLWIPNPDELWIIFLLFAGFGIVNGIFRQNIVAAYTLHFKQRNVAFSVFNVFFMGGIGVQYGLSTFMCVRAKIYTQVGVLTAGAILFVVAECIRAKKLRLQPNADKPSMQATQL